ncbi:MAG: hypothetical protein Q8O72_12365 [Bacteroidales bacterium]|nr:hypothetical protein [Bacteroidales bacterium]
MEDPSFSQSKEAGRQIWKTLQNQWGEAFGFFGGMFSSLLAFIKKQFFGFLIFAILFGALGGTYAWLKKSVYHAEMTVSYAQLEKKIYGDMLFKLNQLLKSKEYSSLAKKLNMPEEEIRQVKSIYGTNIHNQPLVNDISVEKVPFYIEVDVFDVNVLGALQKSVVNYISQSDYINGRLILNERNYKNEIIHMKNQMIYMDSLKMLLLRDCSNLDADAVVNLEKLNKDQNEIFGRIRDLEAALQFNKNIEVMDGFVAHQMPFSSVLIKYILVGMLIGIGLRLLWLMIK